MPGKRIQLDDETWVALDRVRDPGNLGTIIRTADAAGASGVILVGETTDPFALETVRATMGSVFSLPLIRATPAEFLKWQKSAGVNIVATHLKGAVDYRTADYKSTPVVLLMGNDARAERTYRELVTLILGEAGMPWAWEYPEQFAPVQ